MDHTTADQVTHSVNNNRHAAASPSEEPASGPRSHHLPAEIRQNIISHLVVSPEPIILDHEGWPSMPPDLLGVLPHKPKTTTSTAAAAPHQIPKTSERTTPPLLNYFLVSKTFHLEAAHLFYAGNTFSLDLRAPRARAPEGYRAFMHCRCPAHAALRTRVRRLVLRLDPDDDLPPFLRSQTALLHGLLPPASIADESGDGGAGGAGGGSLRSLHVLLEAPKSPWMHFAGVDDPLSALRALQPPVQVDALLGGSAAEYGLAVTAVEFDLAVATAVAAVERLERDGLDGVRKFLLYSVPALLRLLVHPRLLAAPGRGDGGKLSMWAEFHFRQLCGYHESPTEEEGSMPCQKANFQLREWCGSPGAEKQYLDIDLEALAKAYPRYERAGDRPQYRMGWKVLGEGA